MARRKSESLAQSASVSRDRLSAMAAVAKTFSGAKPAIEVIREVEAVPTIFPMIDQRVGVGGFPISRVTIVHGPSNEGKSSYLLGLMRSFVEAGHFASFADAEQSTPKTYAKTMMGEAFDSPLFSSIRVRSYEQTRAAIRDWCEKIAVAREKGQIPDDATGVAVVDSLKNLIPETIWKELEKASVPERTGGSEKKGFRFKDKKSKPGIDGVGGRAGQLQAAYNTAWLMELSSLLAATRTALVAVVRENVIEGTGMFDPDRIELVGGREVRFANSLQLRISRSSIFEDHEGGKRFVGERHKVEIRKTKIAGKQDKLPIAFFHTSNGVLCPEGFDRARDVLELARELGVVTLSGAHYKFGGTRLGQGEGAVLEKLRGDSDLLFGIEQVCRGK